MLLRQNFDDVFEKLLQFDEYSFPTYLRSVVGWPYEVIEFVELFCSQTNQYDLSFTEIIMQNLDFDTKNVSPLPAPYVTLIAAGLTPPLVCEL